MVTVILCLLLFVIMALAIICMLLLARLRVLQQQIAAQSLGPTPKLGLQVPSSPTEQEEALVNMSPLDSVYSSFSEKREQDEPKRKIVVVDDHVEMRTCLQQQLSADFEVLTAENGEQGLVLIRENRPVLVISDVRMPVMTGYELCQALRQDMGTQHIPVILISALSKREHIIYGLEAGAADYIVKPFDMTVLRTHIFTILKRSQEQSDKPAITSVLSKTEYKNQQDKELMDRIVAIVKKRLSDANFSIDELCQERCMSRSSVYGKMKILTGHGPNNLIKTIRLNEAYELLLRRELNVGEVAYHVGFSDPKYFSTCFKKQFGISPNKV